MAARPGPRPTHDVMENLPSFKGARLSDAPRLDCRPIASTPFSQSQLTNLRKLLIPVQHAGSP